jgi:hypothetical protein
MQTNAWPGKIGARQIEVAHGVAGALDLASLPRRLRHGALWVVRMARMLCLVVSSRASHRRTARRASTVCLNRALLLCSSRRVSRPAVAGPPVSLHIRRRMLALWVVAPPAAGHPHAQGAAPRCLWLRQSVTFALGGASASLMLCGAHNVCCARWDGV